MENIELKEQNFDKSYKILILENIPSLNKGEMSIFEGILESLKFLVNFEISMFSDLPEIDKERYEGKSEVIDITEVLGIDDLSNKQLLKIFKSLIFFVKHLLFIINYKLFGDRILKIMKSRIWKEYLTSDLFIIGHNGTFGGGWGMLNTPLYFYYFYIPFFANKLNKPIVLFGGSIPKYNRFKWIFEGLTKFSLNRIDLITLREDISIKNLENLNISNKNVFLKPDLAFLLKPANKDRIEEILKIENIDKKLIQKKPFIGITVTKEMAYKYLERTNELDQKYEKHMSLFVDIINYLTKEFDAHVIFLPHCIGFNKNLDDRIISKKIFEKLYNKSKVKIITNEYDANELKGLMGHFDLFIGERIHSVVNALSMGVPSILLSSKNDQRTGIIKMFEQENIIYLEDMDKQDLISKIDYYLSQKKEIEEEIEIKLKYINKESENHVHLLEKLIQIE